NGGMNWIQQLDNSYEPLRVFFLNNDTGWVGTATDTLYRTTNSGQNWSLQFTFPNDIKDIYFPGSDTGWVICHSTSSINGIFKTLNSGNNWQTQTDPDPFGSGLNGLFFLNN